MVRIRPIIRIFKLRHYRKKSLLRCARITSPAGAGEVEGAKRTRVRVIGRHVPDLSVRTAREDEQDSVPPDHPRPRRCESRPIPLLRKRFERFHGGGKLSLRGAQRRSNPLPDERTSARQAGDCFGAARLAMTGCSGDSTYRENALACARRGRDYETTRTSIVPSSRIVAWPPGPMMKVLSFSSNTAGPSIASPARNA